MVYRGWLTDHLWNTDKWISADLEDCLWLNTPPFWSFPGDGDTDVGDTEGMGSNPGSRGLPGGGNGNPLQYSGLENFIDREAWWRTVHGVANNWTQLSTDSDCHTRIMECDLKARELSWVAQRVETVSPDPSWRRFPHLLPMSLNL